MDRNYDVIAFISKYLRMPRTANFADSIKIVIILVKITFKDSKKLKKLDIMR